MSESYEAQLVAACLRGDDWAWERLFRSCQRALLLSIKLMLGPEARDESLVDEIAAQVWLWLVENDRRLRHFDSRRGRLVTYLAFLARDSVQRHRRSERRRAAREERAATADSRTIDQSLASFESSLDEFLATLTAREREFCEQYLLSSPDVGGDRSYSPANLRQLRRRVFVKLQRHMDSVAGCDSEKK